jgi:hypothetical protein
MSRRKLILPLAVVLTFVFGAQAFALNPQPLPRRHMAHGSIK